MSVQSNQIREPQESDREIDLRIATLLEPEPAFPECKGRLNDTMSPLGAWVHTHISNHCDGCLVLPRSFSSELSLAWRVVEHFQRNGYMVSVNASDGGGYWCCMYPPQGAFIETTIKASPAKAICAAASAAQEQSQK